MKRQLQSLLAISCSILLGLLVSAAISGCQPPSAPPATVKPPKNSNTTDGVPKQPTPSTPKVTVDTDPGKRTDQPPEKGTPSPKPTDTPDASASPETSKTAAPGDSASGDVKLPSENPKLARGDWNQWGGNSIRNNVPVVDPNEVVTEWKPGEFDRETGKWEPETAKNIKWVANLGSQTYGNTVVASGKVFVGTNNTAGYLKRYPADVDLGCLIAFDEKTGQFLWQHSSEKLPTGRVHDWPLMGICCSPLVEGDRVWFVTSRGEVRCLDTEGYYDGEDDGPVTGESAKLFEMMRSEEADQDKVGPAIKELDEGKLPETLRKNFASAGFELPAEVSVSVKEAGKAWNLKAEVGGNEREVKIALQGPRLVASKIVTPADKEEADVVWTLDMMKQLGTSQHNMCSCSVTSWGDLLFVNTSNGVHEDHKTIPAPQAPSFVCLNKHTGKIYWTANYPGANILHGQWSSPTVAIIKDVPQVIFGGGDGWVYSFKANTGKDGKPELLWKFDINEKEALLELGGQGTKNDIIATPVVYDNKVYFATGQDPEHGEGKGIFWCIDPTKRGDISEKLAVKRDATDKPIPVRRVQSVIEQEGEVSIPNPNSGVIWKLTEYDWDGNGDIDDFKERFHRCIGTAAIKNDLLFVADFSGMFFCIDAQSGKIHWGYDMLAASWSSPLIADGKVYAADEDGDIAIFNVSANIEEAMQVVKDENGEKEYYPINAQKPDEESRPEVVNMNNSVYSTPIMANGVLYIANKDHLFAIQNGAQAQTQAASAK
jgi:outer membrane protein assembly factor BamB